MKVSESQIKMSAEFKENQDKLNAEINEVRLVKRR